MFLDVNLLEGINKRKTLSVIYVILIALVIKNRLIKKFLLWTT